MRVVVAGAGIIGCAAAHACATRGADVVVVDPRKPGQGASQASAGMLAPYVEGHNPTIRTLCLDGLNAWPAFAAEFDDVIASRIGFHVNGSLQVAFDDDGARELSTLANELGEAHVVHQLLSGSEARDLEPGLSPNAVLALDIPAHGHVRALELLQALTDHVISAGARIVTDTITSLHDGPDRARVSTAASGVIDADAVIVATGSWTPRLLGDRATVPIRPIRGQLLQLRSRGALASRILWGPGCYVVSRPDGSVLVGATVEDVGFDEHATLDGLRQLSTAATALMPALGAAVVEQVRVGLRPVTPDELPIVGPSATMPHVFYAAGHYRNGVLLAPLTARLMADLVLEGRRGPQLEWLRPSRFGL